MLTLTLMLTLALTLLISGIVASYASTQSYHITRYFHKDYPCGMQVYETHSCHIPNSFTKTQIFATRYALRSSNLILSASIPVDLYSSELLYLVYSSGFMLRSYGTYCGNTQQGQTVEHLSPWIIIGC